MDNSWQDGEMILSKRKEAKEKLENFLHELKIVASDFIPEDEKSFNRKWNRIMVSISGHFNSLDELECIWDELKDPQSKACVSHKAKTKSVGTQKDDLIHWHSLILEADENGNEVLPELEPIDAQSEECKEEPEDIPSVVGDRYIPQEPVEMPVIKKKQKRKSKKQKRQAVRRTNTPLLSITVSPSHTAAFPKMTRSRKRQQTEEPPAKQQQAGIPAEPNNLDVQKYLAHDHFEIIPNEEDSDEEKTEVFKKIKLRRYAKLPDE